MEAWFAENALYILVIFGTIFTYIWLWSFHDTLKLKPGAVFAITVSYTFFDAVCVKLFAVIEYLDISAINKMSLFGAILFMPFVIFGIAKISGIKPLLLFDISTPCFLFMFICGRVNCLIAGCCYGIYLASGFRWPVREAEIAFYLVLMIIFSVKQKKGIFSGTCYAVFLLSYGIFRFAAEFVRYFPDQEGLWHRGHFCAAVSFIAGLIWFIIIRKKKNAADVKYA